MINIGKDDSLSIIESAPYNPQKNEFKHFPPPEAKNTLLSVEKNQAIISQEQQENSYEEELNYSLRQLIDNEDQKQFVEKEAIEQATKLLRENGEPLNNVKNNNFGHIGVPKKKLNIDDQLPEQQNHIQQQQPSYLSYEKTQIQIPQVSLDSFENSEFTSEDENYKYYNYFGNYDRQTFLPPINPPSTKNGPPGLSNYNRSSNATNTNSLGAPAPASGLGLFSTKRDYRPSTYNYFYAPAARHKEELSSQDSPMITVSDDESGFFSESSILSNPFHGSSYNVPSTLYDQEKNEIDNNESLGHYSQGTEYEKSYESGNEKGYDNPLTKIFFPNLDSVKKNNLPSGPQTVINPLNAAYGNSGYQIIGPQLIGDSLKFPNTLIYGPFANENVAQTSPYYFENENNMREGEENGNQGGYPKFDFNENFFGSGIRHRENNLKEYNDKISKSKGKLSHPPGLSTWSDNN